MKSAIGRRRGRILLVALLVVVAVRAVLPYAVRRIAVGQADTALMGHVEIDDVDLALLTGGVTLHGLRVFASERPVDPPVVPPPDAGEGPPGFAPVLSAQRLAVDIGWLPLLRKMVEVQGIELESFAVSVDRTRDGALALPAGAPAEAPPPEPEPSSGWGVLIQRVMLRDGRVGFRDFAVGETPQHLDVTIPTVDAANLALLITDSGLAPGTLSLDAAVRDGTLHLDATIETLAGGPAIETHVALANLPIGDARVYIPHVGWSDLAGRLDTDVVHRFESDGAHTVRGRVGLRDVAVRVPELDQPAVSWHSLGVELGGIDLTKQHADVASITLTGARVVTRPAGPEPLPVLRGLASAAGDTVASDQQPATETVATGEKSRPPIPSVDGAAAPPAAPTVEPTSEARASVTATPTAGSAASPSESPAAMPTAGASVGTLPPSADSAGTAPSPGPSAVEASAGRPWTWTVASVTLDDAGIDVIGGDGPLEIAVDAEVTSLASAAGTHSAVKITVAPASGGTVAVSGDTTMEPLGFDGTLRIDGLVLPDLTLPVATDVTRLLRGGTANADLRIVAGAAPQAPPDGVRITGTLGLAGFDVTGEAPKVFALRWKDLALAMRELSAPGILAGGSTPPPPMTIALSRVALTRAELVATRNATGVALPAAIVGAPAPASAASAGPSTAPTPVPSPGRVEPAPGATTPPQPITLRIDRLAVEKMAIAVSDETVKPFYRSSLDPVDLSAADVRWPGPFARDVKLTAKGLDGATFTLTGTVAPTDSRLVAKLDELPLSPFNPYATASGYGVAGGTARLESTIKLGRGSYDTRSKLVLNKLAVSGTAGESLFASQFGMPLSLALSLLTDVHGNIVLDLPIAGDERGMRLGLGTIVGNALAHAILNAITSPLKLIGVVTKIGEKPAAIVPQPLVFLAGRAELGTGEVEKVKQLAGLLAAAPGVTLHLRGETSAEDRRWLQEQALRAKLAAETGVVSSLRHIRERGPRRAALEVLTARASGVIAEMPADHAAWLEEHVARQEVTATTLGAVAAARVHHVQAQLTSEHGVAAARLLVDATTPDDLAARPVVAIGLGSPPARVPPP